MCVALICIYSHILASPASNIQRRIWQNQFLPLDAMLAQYMLSSCVRLTVCLSQAIHISQSSVATHLRCGGIFKYELVVNLPMSLPVKEFWKSVNIWGSYGQEFGFLFFDSQCSFLMPVISAKFDGGQKNRWFSTIDSLYTEDGTRQTHRSTDRQTDWHRTVT